MLRQYNLFVMKKTILITVGTLIILTIVGVWVYLFMYGTPQSSEEIFANFGKGNTADTVAPQNDAIVDVSDVAQDGERQPLKQLTTRPVAGAGFVEGGIVYVEQGTGHIYHIDLSSGKEEIIRSVTIPGAHEATFSKDGQYVAITTLASGEQKTILSGVDKDEWRGTSLPQGATEITFMSATGTLNYFLKKEQGGTAYSYNILKESNTELFTIPLRDVHVLFGKETYVYTTPSAFQEGYLYQVIDGQLSYVRGGGVGLMGVGQPSGVVVTLAEDNNLISEYHQGESVLREPIPLIPEKCTVSNTRTFCAFPGDTIETGSFPDDWYKGELSYSDILWEIHTTISSATVLSNFLMESGREIDVFRIGTDADGARIYFVNKNDNTLWMFDTTITEN